jgi:hypothetical protein
VQNEFASPRASFGFFGEHEPEGTQVDDDEKPTTTEQELWEWLHYDEGIPLTRRAIKHAVLNREIKPTRIGNCNLYSRQDGWDWIKSRKQPGIYRAPESRAAVSE